MTMNIMSLRVQPIQDLGGQFTDTSSANSAEGGAGVFAEMFSQESETQQGKEPIVETRNEEQAAVSAEEADATDDTEALKQAKQEGTADSDVTEDADAPDARAALVMNNPTSFTQPSLTSDEAGDAVLADKKQSAAKVTAQAQHAMQAESAADKNEQTAQHKQKADTDAQAAHKQGGKVLPHSDAGQLAGSGTDKAVDKAELVKTDAKPSTEKVMPELSAAERAAVAKQLTAANAKAETADTPRSQQQTASDKAVMAAQQAEGDAETLSKSGAQKSAAHTNATLNPSGNTLSNAQTQAAAPDPTQTRSQTAPQTATTAANQATTSASTQAANILAEQADVKMSEQGAAADKANRMTAEQNSQTQARAQAPEWLAQIEHGRRWTQGSAAAQESAATAKFDKANNAEQAASKAAAESVAARALNAKEAGKQPATDRTFDTSVLVEKNSDSTSASLNAQTTVSEPAGFALQRDPSLLAPSPERVLLDKPLNMQGTPDQTAKQLAQQAQVVVSQNLQEADIKLNPSEFGAMKIQVKIENGEVQVQFVASNPQARELLEQAMPRLREMLNQQGLNLPQHQQQAGQQGQQQSQQQQAQQQSGQSGFLSQQGFGQSGEQGQHAEPNHESVIDESNNEWRSYSASGDETLEVLADRRNEVGIGADGVKIDFFA